MLNSRTTNTTTNCCAASKAFRTGFVFCLALTMMSALSVAPSGAFARPHNDELIPPYAAAPFEFSQTGEFPETGASEVQKQAESDQETDPSAPEVEAATVVGATEVDQEPAEPAADKTFSRMLQPIPAEQNSDDENSGADPVQESAAASSAERQVTERESLDSIVDSVAKNMNDKQLYRLAYQLRQGENVRWKVEHTAKTETRMAGHSEKTSMRSQSVKRWEVTSVDSLGVMTFTYIIESTNDWFQIGEQEPVTFDSTSGEKPPEDYQAMADKVGKPLGVISINPSGQITDKKTVLNESSFGTGDTTVPLPDKLVAVGHEWNVPKTMSATDEEDRVLSLKARIHYELARVKLPHAYIAFRTEVLTPITSPQVESQIMQQMTKGYLVFDIQRGIMVKKEVEWNEQVQGFAGPDSFLNYVGKLSETLVTGDTPVATAPAAPGASERSGAVELKTRDAAPVIRK